MYSREICTFTSHEIGGHKSTAKLQHQQECFQAERDFCVLLILQLSLQSKLERLNLVCSQVANNFPVILACRQELAFVRTD